MIKFLAALFLTFGGIGAYLDESYGASFLLFATAFMFFVWMITSRNAKRKYKL